MSETAKAAKIGATDALDDAFQNPTPWMRRAFTYKRALSRTGDIVEAEVSVLPSQSIVMKYAMGSGPQTRRPGDVGLAKDRILVPYWRNLQETQVITINRYGNLPGGVAARLTREAAGKRRVSGRWGVYRQGLPVCGSKPKPRLWKRPSSRSKQPTSGEMYHCKSRIATLRVPVSRQMNNRLPTMQATPGSRRAAGW